MSGNVLVSVIDFFFDCWMFITVFITLYIIDLEIRMEVLRIGHCCDLFQDFCDIPLAQGKQIHLSVKLHKYGQTQRKDKSLTSSLKVYSFFPGYIMVYLLGSSCRSPEVLLKIFWIRKYWGLRGLSFSQWALPSACYLTSLSSTGIHKFCLVHLCLRQPSTYYYLWYFLLLYEELLSVSQWREYKERNTAYDEEYFIKCF